MATMSSSSGALTAWVTGRVRSFGFAFRGLRVLVGEHNARIHLAAALSVVVLGGVFRVSAIEWCLLTLSIVAVLAAEGFNTALERLSDAVSREPHPLLGAAKDVSAGAVLLTALGASVVGALIFGPRLLTLP
jgi:diacylglycerol kinase (ATP)